MATKAGGGGGGTSAYNSDACTLQSGTSSASGVDPYVEVEYTSASESGSQVTTTTKVSGWTSKTLRVQRDTVGIHTCLLYTSPSPRDKRQSRMPSSA